MERMAAELPQIRESLNLTVDALAEKTGVEAAKIKAAESGKRSFKWSEFMSILFVIWNNDIGKGMLDSKGLFPDALKKALSVNRNAHAPGRNGQTIHQAIYISTSEANTAQSQ